MATGSRTRSPLYYLLQERQGPLEPKVATHPTRLPPLQFQLVARILQIQNLRISESHRRQIVELIKK